MKRIERMIGFGQLAWRTVGAARRAMKKTARPIAAGGFHAGTEASGDKFGSARKGIPGERNNAITDNAVLCADQWQPAITVIGGQSRGDHGEDSRAGPTRTGGTNARNLK
jgi:hypothetical protein